MNTTEISIIAHQRKLSREIIFIQDSRMEDGKTLSRCHVKITDTVNGFSETFMEHVIDNQLMAAEIAKSQATLRFIAEPTIIKEEQLPLPVEEKKEEAVEPPPVPTEEENLEKADAIPAVIEEPKKEKKVAAKKEKKEVITPYDSVKVPEHKVKLAAFLNSNFGDSWKSPENAPKVKALTATLQGKDFLDSKGEIVESFREEFRKVLSV